MLLFVKDSRNRPLYPTTKIDWAEKLVKQKKAIFIRKRIIILKLSYQVTKAPRDTLSYFILGLDTGYKHIGYCLIKVTGSKIQKLIAGEAVLRTEEIKERLTERKMYRQSKRRNRRNRANSQKFRHPRWKNRRDKQKLSPTVRHLIESHTNLVKFICKLVPWDKLQINLEYAKFDMQLLTRTSNPTGLGANNATAYALARDSYTCQKCQAQNTQLEVHHKIPRSQGGSNRPSNLITLCTKCHSLHHAGKINANGIIPKLYRDTSVLNSAMPYIYKALASWFPTYKFYGYETKAIALANKIEKSHANDAMILAAMNLQIVNWIDYKIELDFRQFRRHNRARAIRIENRHYYDPTKVVLTKKGEVNKKSMVTLATNRRKRTGQTSDSLEDFRKKNPKLKVAVEPGRIIYKQPYSQVKYSPGDICETRDEVFIIRSWASTQSKVISIDDEEFRYQEIAKVKANAGMCIN